VIRKLRKKLIVVLMAVVCLFLVGILTSLFITSKSEYERRSTSGFREPPPEESTAQPSSDPARIDMPVAIAQVDAAGTVTVSKNQIYYLTDADLIAIVGNLVGSAEDSGLTSQYDLRYRRRTGSDGAVLYFLTDTLMERRALNAQLLYSGVIGVGAVGLFFLVSMLLSRWMVRPVEIAWEKQRQFVADASHELRTPLTVVLANADMMTQSGLVTDEKNKNRLQNILAESQRMKGLVESLLTLARTDQKPTLQKKESVNLSYLVNGSTLALESTLFDAKRALDVQVAENLTVAGDAARLRQLVEILLDNACKYGAAGTPVTVRMGVAGRREALLSVASEGAPISPEECESIFERFYRSDKSRGEVKGYGLGLAIARSIAQEHGGRIWAQSDGVKVNTFFVKLPLLEGGQEKSLELTGV
jgi:signal transduction histidine kinase